MSETHLTPAGQPAPAEFDYSGLDKQTQEVLKGAKQIFRQGKRMTDIGMLHMANAVGIVHDELVANCDNSKFGNRDEDSFRQFCKYELCISKDTAYRFLQVSDLYINSTPEQQKVLNSLSPSLLYAAAKPSAPADLVQAVKDGDITTHKQYQELLKENQQLRTDRVNALNRAQAAESQRDAAMADVDGLHEQNDHLRRSYDYANEAYKAADAQRKQAENERDKANARTKEAEQRYQAAQTYAEEMERQADLAETEKAELTTRLREMENRPRDVAVMQPSEADKEKYRKEGETRMMDAAQKLADSANAARDEALQTLADLQDALPDADSCQRLADAAADALDGFSVALRSSLKAANLDAGLFCSVTRRVCASARKLLGYLEACTPAGADEDEEDDIFQ